VGKRAENEALRQRRMPAKPRGQNSLVKIVSRGEEGQSMHPSESGFIFARLVGPKIPILRDLGDLLVQ
jgi:hypothetical protein